MTPSTTSPYVVTVTPTISDGVVVRWHMSLGAAGGGYPVLSASRNAVIVHEATLRSDAAHEALRQLLDHAFAVQVRIRRGDDVRDLATHERRGLTGPMVPVDGTP